MYIYDNVSPNSSQNEKCFRRNLQSIKAHILCSVTFRESRVVNAIPWKNMVEPDRPQMTIYNTAHALCMLDNESYKHSLRICNTYCFSTATVLTRTRLIVTFIRKLPVLLCGYEN
jgi:hypothetical protein